MKNLFVLLLLVVSGPVFSDNENYIPGGENDWWFIGGELGLMDKTDISSPEVENNGLQIGIKGVYSRYWKDFIADIGLGYRYDEMDDSVEIQTKAFFFELGARYRLSDRWSIGPQLQMLLGRDVSFSDAGTNSDDKSSALFAGARIFYDFSDPKDDFMIRVGAQGFTDINIDDRKITYLQLVAEVGWPFGKAEEPTPVLEPEPEVEEKPRIKFSLKRLGVNFKTNSFQLNDGSKQIIEELATVLSEYSDQWSKLKIFGHTDATGNDKKNMELSKVRARTVRNIFRDNSVPKEKIEAKGFGEKRLIDPANTKEAHSKNRRVELKIYSKNAGEDFLRQLNDILEKHSSN